MEVSHMLTMLVETLFGIFALYILTRFLGKTQISQLTAFDFIAAIILGELVGNALFDHETGIIEIGYVILIWGIILYIIEIIAQKYKRSRFLLEGKPSVLIHKGEIIYEEMRKNKIDINELLHLLRVKDIFSIQEVEYAILETNGDLSVLKKAAFQTPTKKDLELPLTTPEIAMTIILDGEFIYDNIAEVNLNENWIKKELKRQEVHDVKDVFYAEYKSGKLFVLPYNKIKQKDYVKKKQS